MANISMLLSRAMSTYVQKRLTIVQQVGGLTSVTASAPLVSSGGLTPDISILPGQTAGDLLIWDGAAWVPTAPAPSGVLGAAMFFGVSGAAGAPDYAATVAIGAAMPFPQDGPTTGGADAPTRTAPDTFQINAAGVYDISYQASVDEPGQLAVWVNGAAVGATRAGRATGTNQIANRVLMTLALNDLLTVRNDASGAALTVTPIAGGTGDAGATLVIRRVS